MKSQEKNDSWGVPKTAFAPSEGYPTGDKQPDVIYTYWGTAWAIIGLLHTLPVPEKKGR